MAASKMVLIAAAVRTGRVLFSTTIVWPLAAWATVRAQASTQRRSLAWPAPSPFVFGGRVHRNEHHVGIRNRGFHTRRKTEIAPPGPAHHSIQARLIHRQSGQVWIVPSIDARLVEVHHRDLNLRTTISDHRHGWAAHVASTNAADALDGHASG